MSDIVRGIVAPERVFERGRGCWNCTAFSNDDLARRLWKDCRARDMAFIATSGSLPRLGDLEHPNPSGQDARLDRIHAMDELVANGRAGLCLKGPRPKDLGGPEGDFVHFKHFCDRWNGRDGHSVATAGRPMDKLNEELADIAEDRAKPK